jgi:hypothetical protein
VTVVTLVTVDCGVFLSVGVAPSKLPVVTLANYFPPPQFDVSQIRPSAVSENFSLLRGLALSCLSSVALLVGVQLLTDLQADGL